MDERQLAFLQRLMEVPSPSGFEEKIQQAFYREVTSFCENVTVDVYGNVIATIKGQSSRSILLAGHCDEIGLIVKHIDEKGFLFFGPVGGVDPYVLIGQRVNLLGPQGPMPGVIGRVPFHLQEKDDRDKDTKIKFQDLTIDIGARDREQALRVAPVGTPAVWGPSRYQPLLGGLATARAFDDKVGMWAVAETLRLLAARSSKPPFTVIGASTIQEECGVWGAGPVAYGLKPEAAVAVDVTHATDYPGIEKKQHGELYLGQGPVIFRGVKSSKVLSGWLESTASRHGIAVQFEAESGRFGTDADPIADRRAGIPVNTLGIPLRYMHTAAEVVSLDDLEATAILLSEALSSLPGDIDFAAFRFEASSNT